MDFVNTFTVILPSVTLTLDNSNLSLTRTNFHFPSSNFVYNFIFDNSWGVGRQGGQNLPLPVPCSPTSRTFISRFPPYLVLLASLSVASKRSWWERRTGIARSRVQTPLKSRIVQASVRNCRRFQIRRYIHDACVSYTKETIFSKLCNFLHFLSYPKLPQRPSFWDKCFFLSSLKFKIWPENWKWLSPPPQPRH